MSDFEIKIDITKSSKKEDDKKYSRFLKGTFKLLEMRDKRKALENKLEKLMADIYLLEEELESILDD